MTKPTTERITSIDIFRGLTILTMIFVNDLASIHNIPAWMKHAPTGADTMTFVDLVFPAFLFIVGMAIPFAIQKRIDRGETIAHIWKHILIRTIGLIVLGVFMVNLESLNPAATGMLYSWWMLLLFIAVILVWNQYPKAAGWKRMMVLLLRSAGFVMLIFLAAIYRGGESEQVHWMQTSWWGILGLIGWAYLTCCAVYFLFRKNLPAMIGILALFIALYIGDKNGRLDFLAPISKYIWLGGHIGGHSSITLAGMIIATLFLEGSPAQTARIRMKWIAAFALMLYLAGYLLRPLYGISKNNATPTWCLYSSAMCCLIFLLLYWIVDLKKIEKWARFLKPAGENPLLAYILPDIFYALMGILGIKFLARYFGTGLIGIIRSFVFALVMLWITGLLTKLKIRLHL
jgi:heparan-alpha-glucosaminide N-acetyltransferase